MKPSSQPTQQHRDGVETLLMGDGDDPVAKIDAMAMIPLPRPTRRTLEEANTLSTATQIADKFVDPLDADKVATQAQIDKLVDSLTTGSATKPSVATTSALLANKYADPLDAEKEADEQRIEEMVGHLTARTGVGDVLLSHEFVDPLDTEREAREQRIDHILSTLSPSTTVSSPMLLARSSQGFDDSLPHVMLGAALLLVVAVVLGVMTKRSEKAVRKPCDECDLPEQKDFEYILLV